MRPLLALAFKDMKLLFRDKMGFFFTLIYPLFVAVLFGSMFSGEGSSKPARIRLAVADEDSTAQSRAFIDSLRTVEGLSIIETTREQGYEMVRLSKAVGCLVIKKDFGRASKNLFWGNPPAVDLAVDPSRKPEKAMIEGILMGKASQRITQFFLDTTLQRNIILEQRAALDTSDSIPSNLKKALTGLFVHIDSLILYQREKLSDSLYQPEKYKPDLTPLKIAHTEIPAWRRLPKSGYLVAFPQAASWVLIAVTANFSLMLVTEKSQGTLMRLLVSPLPAAWIHLGKAIAGLFSTVIVIALLFLLGYLGFNVVPSSVPLLAFAVLCSAICFLSLVMLFSSLGSTPGSVAGVTWATLLTFAVFGGGMVPLVALPGWMRSAGSFSPVKWSILAIEGAVWRKFSFAEMMKPCVIIILMAALSLFVTFRLLHASSGYGRNR